MENQKPTNQPPGRRRRRRPPRAGRRGRPPVAAAGLPHPHRRRRPPRAQGGGAGAELGEGLWGGVGWGGAPPSRGAVDTMGLQLTPMRSSTPPSVASLPESHPAHKRPTHPPHLRPPKYRSPTTSRAWWPPTSSRCCPSSTPRRRCGPTSSARWTWGPSSTRWVVKTLLVLRCIGTWIVEDCSSCCVAQGSCVSSFQSVCCYNLSEPQSMFAIFNNTTKTNRSTMASTCGRRPSSAWTSCWTRRQVGGGDG
jgi:hypothetical protein